MSSYTAQNLLDENNYTTTDCSLINAERLIDKAIRYVNLRTGRSMSTMGGTAGSKTVSMEDDELGIVQTLGGLLVRAFVDKGPNVGIGGLSVSSTISDPQYSLFKHMIDMGIRDLKEIEVDYG